MKKVYGQFATLAIGTTVSAIASLAFANSAHALSLTTYQIYTQNFDTLANPNSPLTNNIPQVGGSNPLPDGWSFVETGNGADQLYRVNNGTANDGGAYSYGSSDNTETNPATDRALGTIQQNQNRSAILGVLFNITAPTTDPITDLIVSYRGEQWGRGSASVSVPDQLLFEYSTTATSLTDTTGWTGVSALNFLSPVTTGNASRRDGNATGNFTNLQATISGLNLTNGQKIWFRWLDFDRTEGGSQDNLAIDDFSVTAVPTPALLPGLIGLGLGVLRKRKAEVSSEEV